MTASCTITARFRVTPATAEATRCAGALQQEHDLADQLFLRRQLRQLLNLRDRKHAPFDHAGLELERRNILGDFRERLGQRHRIGRGVGDRIGARKILEQRLGRGARAGVLGQRILNDLIVAAGGLHRAAELRCPRATVMP